MTDSSSPSPSDAYPQRLADVESDLVAGRRLMAEVDTAAPRVGLALSGGGIRSATFCLGVLQTLARLGLLRRVDYLSTVSGGGYCGGFLGRLVGRPAWQEGTRSGITGAEAELADRDSRVIGWLREHGRYLSPNGAGDTLLAFAVVLRNWMAVTTVLLTFVAAVLALVVVARVGLDAHGIRASEGVIWWSPLWGLVLPWLVAAVPLGWAYWMVPRVDPRTLRAISKGPLWRSAAAAAAMIAGAAWYYTCGTCDGRPLAYLLAFGALLLAVAAAILLWLWKSRRWNDPPRRDRLARSWLSQGVATMLQLAGAIAILALVDSLGETLCVWLSIGGGIGVLGRVAGLIGGAGGAAVVRWLISLSRKGDGTGRMPLPLTVVAGLAAVLVGGAALVGVSAAVHAVAWNGWLWPGCDPLGSALVLFGGTGLLSFLFGSTVRFANDSSQQALYAARLARAYLGASNPKRQDGAGRRITDPIAGDDASLSGYAPHAAGGPLHLINATLNETVAGESQIEHRDRKGLGFAVGPAGLSAGVRHHALWGKGLDENGKWVPSTDRIEPIAPASGFRVFVAVEPPPAEADPGQVLLDRAPAAATLQRVEPLSLATWIAVSGAAVAPGLGAKTSLGFSLLLTIFNVRLGYWWDSFIRPRQRRAAREGDEQSQAAADSRLRALEKLGQLMAWLFPVQTSLCYELLGRFYGPNRQRWYLSDGGHFENTAAYELIRRRIPFIIVCDCGQDQGFEFADVANLVRKARTDFKAEITFLDGDEIPDLPAELQPRFGLPSAFSPLFATDAGGHSVRASTARPRPYAMLARVDYDGRPAASTRAPDAVILFLKPSLSGTEPEDVLRYAQEHPAFPHESTGDQYFDEAQWESYRMLGERIASRVFGEDLSGVSGWTPAVLRPPRFAA